MNLNVDIFASSVHGTERQRHKAYEFYRWKVSRWTVSYSRKATTLLSISGLAPRSRIKFRAFHTLCKLSIISISQSRVRGKMKWWKPLLVVSWTDEWLWWKIESTEETLEIWRKMTKHQRPRKEVRGSKHKEDDVSSSCPSSSRGRTKTGAHTNWRRVRRKCARKLTNTPTNGCWCKSEVGEWQPLLLLKSGDILLSLSSLHRPFHELPRGNVHETSGPTLFKI